jgi:hypothetical protein
MSRGLIDSLIAAEHRSQRAASRDYRAWLAEQKALAKWSAQMQAHETVTNYLNYVEAITTLHREVGPPYDWRAIAAMPPPAAVGDREHAAREALAAWRPSLVDQLFGRVALKRAPLERAVEQACAEDAAVSNQQYATWQWFRSIADGVLRGDLHAYAAIVERLNPFDRLREFGATEVGVRTNEPWFVRATADLSGPDIVPDEECRLLASGKLTTKPIPKGTYWSYYQEYICGAALRLGHEIAHLLPVQKVYVDIRTPHVDAATGHDGQRTVLSVEFERGGLLALNFERVIASAAIGRFSHNVSFKKTAGFSGVASVETTMSITST